MLEHDELTVVGRLGGASNATFLAEIGDVRVVYKPVAGESPLWDFPDGTLARREVAAYAVSEALGWEIVPVTLLRDGPAGVGMVQLWCDTSEGDSSADPVAVVPGPRPPHGYLRVLDAYDHLDREVTLVHEDTDALLRIAVFDVLVNNADRKGGHVLAVADGRRRGIDHGVTFHVEPKLRTVLWGWAGERVPPELLEQVRDLPCDNALLRALSELLDPEEVHAFVRRCERLVRKGTMPRPEDAHRAYPWPLF